MTHCLWMIKERNLFLSLSFTRFTMIHKKRTSLLSFRVGKDVLKHGNIDTFKSTYW
jgi:hypothetical protein